MDYFDLDGYVGDQDREYGAGEIDLKTMPLMQFTGVLDKNGKEIYEGDIVRCTKGKYTQGWGPIEYREERGSFVVMSYGDVPRIYEEWWWQEKEIVGNIYENPELLPYGKPNLLPKTGG